VLDTDLPPIEEAFSKSEIKTIPKATHWVHAEEPELFYQYVTEFLGR